MKIMSPIRFWLIPLFFVSAVQAQPPVVESTGQDSSVVIAETTPGGTSMNRNMLEMLNRLDQLEREIRQLRGDIEIMIHETNGIKDRQRELYLDMDRRLREVELGNVRSAGNAQAATPPVDTTPQTPVQKNGTPAADKQVTSTTQTAAVSSVPTREEKTEYRRAFNLLKEGRYDQSISAFHTFLNQYPQSSYSDNAQYWLGEANYVSRKYEAAVKEFNKVMSSYPQSTKVPDAMLKLGFTHYELKQWDQARSTLEDVVRKYPKSSAARLADTRLKRMQREGK